MSKEYLASNLADKQHYLAECRARLQELKEKYGILEETETAFHVQIGLFEQSIQQRQRKLMTIQGLATTVKSAQRYQEKMNNMLTGTEYQTAIGYIEQLQLNFTNEKRKVVEDIQYLEREINNLENSIATLQYEYDNFEKEEDNVR